MNILQVNKFYHIVGGSSRYIFDISKLLEDMRHKLGYFSMEDKKNKSTNSSKYFVSNISFEKVELKNFLRIAMRMFYFVEAYRKISTLLDEFQLDIVHLHSIYHHLSPSIILKLRQRNIPIVQTIHDYHLISPNRSLFHNNKICEVTKPNKFYRAIFHKCVKDSYIYSVAEVLEKYFHYILGWERNYIDYFIAPSKFMRNKLIEYGLPSEKIIHLPHFVDYKQYKPNYNHGDYILYFGRLSPEKGINCLIEAMKFLPKINLKIAGRGNEEYEKKLKAQSSKLKNIEFVGFKDGYELKKLIANSRFTVLPSVWHEVFGLSILESFASGKPVIASDIGGIPETVKNGLNGLLVQPGDGNDLANKINKLWNNPSLCKKMGRNARGYVEKYFSPEDHYGKMIGIYKKAINLHK